MERAEGKWRILRCATCKTEFSERKGTALWGTRMSPEKAIAIAEHLKEGCGIRKTARLVGASKDGVTSIALRVGLHAHAFHDERARDLQVHEAQFDEKWAFVEKKNRSIVTRQTPKMKGRGISGTIQLSTSTVDSWFHSVSGSAIERR